MSKKTDEYEVEEAVILTPREQQGILKPKIDKAIQKGVKFQELSNKMGLCPKELQDGYEGRGISSSKWETVILYLNRF